MQNRHRTLRNLIISLIVTFYLISIGVMIILTMLFHLFELEIISLGLVIVSALMMLITLVLGSLLYKKYILNNGFKSGLRKFLFELKIRKNLLDANYYFIRTTIFGDIAELPKIKILFDNDAFGKIYIENSIRFDKSFEDLRLSSSLNKYVVENYYVSKDSNWYIYYFYDSSLIRQLHFKSADAFREYSLKVSLNELFLDEFNIVPIHHMLLVGQTGSGKTYALFSLILQLINKVNNPILYFADTKGAGTTTLGNTLAKSRTASTLECIIKQLEQFNNDMQKRKKDIEIALMNNIDSDYSDLGLSPQIFIFDEYADFHLLLKTQKKDIRDRVDFLLSTIVLQGRQLGFFIWITMQKSDATLIPTYLRDNLVLKIVLGNAEKTTYQTTFGISSEIPNNNYSIGQGVYTYPGLTNKPKICSFSYLDFNIIEAFKQNARIVNTGVPKEKESEYD